MSRDNKVARALAEANDKHGAVFSVMVAISMMAHPLALMVDELGNKEISEAVNAFVGDALAIMHSHLAEDEFTREEFVSFLMSADLHSQENDND